MIGMAIRELKGPVIPVFVVSMTYFQALVIPLMKILDIPLVISFYVQSLIHSGIIYVQLTLLCDLEAMNLVLC
jgi:hypothetical protein